MSGFRFSLALLLGCSSRRGSGFVPSPLPTTIATRSAAGSIVTMMSSTASSKAETIIPSWSDLQSRSQDNAVGKALENETALRKTGAGSAHVQNSLRKFDSSSSSSGLPPITLYRDHAGWCPYCQKLMLLVEEKEVPVQISLVPMRSYGDKPREFLQKVPNGLLPAMEINGQIITESQVIMELLDQLHPPQNGYRPMLPSEDDRAGRARYQRLANLERELFSWWCTLVFRPEGGGMPGLGGGFNFFQQNKDDGNQMSASMSGFLDCIRKVDRELLSTKGPWFFDDQTEYPTMIDFVYVSHVERMLASCAHWKGLDLRDVSKWNLKGLNAWLEAFEKRESYLAFKSDYYTHVMDIPPQYGPGYDGGFENDRKQFAASITGRDGSSWHLPLSHDDPLQPLYKGPPLPVCVLEAAGLTPDNGGSYESCDPVAMEKACRLMAAWKLAGNGEKVSRFASRGGPKGGRNPRKTFGAPLADPYANSDDNVVSYVDASLRIVCEALLMQQDEETTTMAALEDQLLAAVPAAAEIKAGVVSSLEYVRDRVGVPRDLPLASARYLRAYLNWAISVLEK